MNRGDEGPVGAQALSSVLEAGRAVLRDGGRDDLGVGAELVGKHAQCLLARRTDGREAVLSVALEPLRCKVARGALLSDCDEHDALVVTEARGHEVEQVDSDMNAYQHEEPVVHKVAQQAVPEHLWLVGEVAKGLLYSSRTSFSCSASSFSSSASAKVEVARCDS